MLLKLYRSRLFPLLIAYNTIEFAQAVPISHHLDMIQGNSAAAVAKTDMQFLHNDPYSAAALAQVDVQSFAALDQAAAAKPAIKPAKGMKPAETGGAIAGGVAVLGLLAKGY